MTSDPYLHGYEHGQMDGYGKGYYKGKYEGYREGIDAVLDYCYYTLGIMSEQDTKLIKEEL